MKMEDLQPNNRELALKKTAAQQRLDNMFTLWDQLRSNEELQTLEGFEKFLETQAPCPNGDIWYWPKNDIASEQWTVYFDHWSELRFQNMINQGNFDFGQNPDDKDWELFSAKYSQKLDNNAA